MRCRRSSLGLVVLALLAAAVLFVALPRLAATEAMERRIDAAERAGIDPGAVFYTEHAFVARTVQSPGAVSRSK